MRGLPKRVSCSSKSLMSEACMALASETSPYWTDRRSELKKQSKSTSITLVFEEEQTTSGSRGCVWVVMAVEKVR